MAGIRATTPMFKPVPGGYVFRPPNRWVFWRRRFYLVNETQKAELLSIIAARGLRRARGHIFIVALAGPIFSATMIVACASGHSEPTARDAVVLLGMPFCFYGALVISIWLAGSNRSSPGYPNTRLCHSSTGVGRLDEDQARKKGLDCQLLSRTIAVFLIPVCEFRRNPATDSDLSVANVAERLCVSSATLYRYLPAARSSMETAR